MREVSSQQLATQPQQGQRHRSSTALMRFAENGEKEKSLGNSDHRSGWKDQR